MFVFAYAFLTTYQVYYLLEKLGSAADDVPRQLFLATLAMSSVVVVASLVGGWLSDRTRRRKVFVVDGASGQVRDKLEETGLLSYLESHEPEPET